MHMIQVIAGGVVLLGVFCLFGRLWGADTAGVVMAAKIFIPAWLVVALVNMWVGVTHAGFTVMQELPILLIVFAVPALFALAVIWQITRS